MHTHIHLFRSPPFLCITTLCPPKHAPDAPQTQNRTIPQSWTVLPWLNSLDVSHNNLEGTIPPDLALGSMLAGLRVDGNRGLTGTLSPWFRLSTSLTTIMLHNTSMEGSLPGYTRWEIGRAHV